MKRQRIVVKIGSSSLTTTNGVCMEKLADHVAAIAKLKAMGHDVVLITSGAVAAGFAALGYPTRPVTMKGKQAAAAVGQGLLMQAYTAEFQKHSIITAQLLLTRSDFSRKEQYSNAYAALSELLDRHALPIINENDSVSLVELTFGDNDMLSALVSGLVYADMLIILTDVNGLYDSNPRDNPDAKRFSYLPSITDEIAALAKGSGTKVGTGGMKSKIDAAKTAVSLGVNVFIGTGQGEDKLLDILLGKGDGTYIGHTEQKTVNTNKQWISLHSIIRGRISIDTGAARAVVQNGKSLLPAGVTTVEGNFVPGDVVEVLGPKGTIIGRGQVQYSAYELEQVKGKQSFEIMQQEERHSYEVIHRDNWVTL
ncbi:glutamate 5-kinase [Ectobacillus sp. sgz5001026]|uniref:glutamate 5-kinase n=1 Tax=Ectobacillus sp. sgz5001026 TaxID=3242473 RepID=UPI0036D248AD